MIAKDKYQKLLKDFSFKSLWEHPNVAKPMKIVQDSINNNLNCFDSGLCSQVIMTVGLGTFKGLVSRAESNPGNEIIRLDENFVLKRENKLNENLLLSQGQIVYLLESLLKVGLFYHEKRLIHGDFTPGNISNHYFLYCLILEDLYYYFIQIID